MDFSEQLASVRARTVRFLAVGTASRGDRQAGPAPQPPTPQPPAPATKTRAQLQADARDRLKAAEDVNYRRLFPRP